MQHSEATNERDFPCGSRFRFRADMRRQPPKAAGGHAHRTRKTSRGPENGRADRAIQGYAGSDHRRTSERFGVCDAGRAKLKVQTRRKTGRARPTPSPLLLRQALVLLVRPLDTMIAGYGPRLARRIDPERRPRA